MPLIVPAGRPGDYWARCFKCGQMNLASDMEEPPLQTPGGPPAGFLICKRHEVKYHPGNDWADILAAYTDPDPVPQPQPDETHDLIPDSGITPTLTSVSPSSTTAAALLLAPTLTLVGTVFSSALPRSVVTWDGVSIPTTYVSTTGLTGVVPAHLITVGTHTVKVNNQGPPFPAVGWGGSDSVANLSNALSVTLS